VSKNGGNSKEDVVKKKRVSLPLKGLVSGDMFSKGMVTKNLSFLLFIALLMLIYIGYGYYVDNTVRKVVREERVKGDLYSELQSLMEVYDQESLRSKVANEVAVSNLFEIKDPPRVVLVENNFYNKSAE
jgi:hypothetical protein